MQPKDAPLEFYLEGNIVFREGDRVIYAERMYYNVRQQYGIVLNAEVLTPAPGYQGLIRLKAEVLQQLDQANFRALERRRHLQPHRRAPVLAAGRRSLASAMCRRRAPIR